MTKKKTKGTSPVVSVILIVLVLAAAGLLATVNLTAGIGLLIGGLVALLLVWALRRWGWKVALPILIVVLVGGLLMVVMFMLGGRASAPGDIAAGEEAVPQGLELQAEAAGFTLIIEPMDDTMTTFLVRPEVTATITQGETDLAAESFSLQPYEVESVPSGFLLREVQIPLPSPALIDYEGELIAAQTCRSICIPASIEVIDLPSGAFFDARESESLQSTTYVNAETISWTVSEPRQQVDFAVIPPPFNGLNAALKPLIGISTLTELAGVLIGLVGTLVIGLVVSALEQWLVDLIKSIFKKDERSR